MLSAEQLSNGTNLNLGLSVHDAATVSESKHTIETAECAHLMFEGTSFRSKFILPVTLINPDPCVSWQVLIGGRQAGRLSRDGPFNVSLGPAAAYLGADDKEKKVRLDIIVEGLFRSNEGWRFDTKGLASPHVLWNGMQQTSTHPWSPGREMTSFRSIQLPS